MKNIILIFFAALISVSCGRVYDEYYQRTETTIPEDEDPGTDPGTDPGPGEITVDPDSYWYQAAESATMELINRYWPPLLTKATASENTIYNWHFTEKQDKKGDANNNYWHQAHAIEPIIDAYNRTPTTPEYADQKQFWLDIMDKWFQGVPRFQWMWETNWASSTWTSRYPAAKTGNSNGWRNEYIDDMAWMVLTQIRMYESTRAAAPELAAKYLATAKELYDDYIWDWGWDDPDPGVNKGQYYNKTGGLYWKRDATVTMSKNSCINGPGIIIAGKLAYHSSGEDKEKYLGQAIAIYDWMKGNIWRSTDGFINDNISSTGTKANFTFCYSQGTFAGGCHWLYKLTDDDKYLTDAILATEYTINNQQDTADGGVRILKSDSDAAQGNNTAFRGIFIRYLVDLINEPDLDGLATGNGIRQKWYDNLEGWANYVWREGKGIDNSENGAMIFGYDWRKQPTAAELTTGINLGNMLSGAILVEAMNIAKNPTPTE